MDRDDWLHRRLKIFGRVQGVCFRASTQEQAERLRVSGWVKNQEDGSVEAELHGLVDQVEALIAWCRNGPPGARVDRVEVMACPPVEKLEPGFKVVRY